MQRVTWEQNIIRYHRSEMKDDVFKYKQLSFFNVNLACSRNISAISHFIKDNYICSFANAEITCKYRQT
jgi:hypothetical protein